MSHSAASKIATNEHDKQYFFKDIYHHLGMWLLEEVCERQQFGDVLDTMCDESLVDDISQPIAEFPYQKA